MKVIRIFFAAVFLAAIYDVAVCVVTESNPLVSLVITVFAVSSWFLLDWLEGEHDRRIAETRDEVWLRRSREW